MIGLLNIGRHQRLRTLLSSYIDGQVTPSEAARLEGHLSGCQQCQSDLESLRSTVGLLRAMPELALSRSFALDRAPEPSPAPWPLVRVGGALAATDAVLLIALLAGDLTGLLEQTGRPVGDGALAKSAAVTVEMAKEAEAEVEVVVEKEVVKEVAVERDRVADVREAAEPVEEMVVEADTEAAALPLAAAAPLASVDDAAPEATAAPAGAVAASQEARAEPDVRPQDTIAPAGVDEARSDSRAVTLPLRQLELALAALLAASGVAALALVLRRRRSP